MELGTVRCLQSDSTTETEPNPSYLVYSDLEEFYPDAMGVTTNTETAGSSEDTVQQSQYLCR